MKVLCLFLVCSNVLVLQSCAQAAVYAESNEFFVKLH